MTTPFETAVAQLEKQWTTDTRWAGVERGMRLVVGHLRFQHLRFRDIGGIGNNGIEVRSVEGSQQI